MIECYIDDFTVIGSHLAQGRRRLEFISNALGRRQENTPDLLLVHQAEHTPSHLPVGNLKLQSIVSGVWEESEGFGGNPWKHKEKHETSNICFYIIQMIPVGNLRRSFDLN